MFTHWGWMEHPMLEKLAMKRLVISAAIVLFGAGLANAQTTSTPATPATAAASAAPTKSSAPAKGADRIICEHEEVLGSRLQGRRVCKTAAQWAEERQAAREEVLRAQTMRGCGNGYQC